MAYPVRVIQQVDGSVIVIHPAMNDKTRPDGIPDGLWAQDKINQTINKHPEWQELPFIDCFNTELPTGRQQRHKWRVQGGKVVVDNTIPDLPHPRQSLLNAIQNATT